MRRHLTLHGVLRLRCAAANRGTHCRFASLRMTAVAMLAGTCVIAAEPRPVPRMQAIPFPHAEIAFTRDGVELARYHFHPEDKRPFLYPIIGPSGVALTRMEQSHDPDHSHHNSVWISHHDVNGISFGGSNRTEDRASANH